MYSFVVMLIPFYCFQNFKYPLWKYNSIEILIQELNNLILLKTLLLIRLLISSIDIKKTMREYGFKCKGDNCWLF